MLLTSDVEVEPVAVRDVVALMVRLVAEQIGMDQEEALRLVQPETVGRGDHRCRGPQP